jgi:hypothetical protein
MRDPPVTIHPTSLIYCWLTLLFPKLQIVMKGTRLEAVQSIQQTVKELKEIQEDAFDSLYA